MLEVHKVGTTRRLAATTNEQTHGRGRNDSHDDSLKCQHLKRQHGVSWRNSTDAIRTLSLIGCFALSRAWCCFWPVWCLGWARGTFRRGSRRGGYSRKRSGGQERKRSEQRLRLRRRKARLAKAVQTVRPPAAEQRRRTKAVPYPRRGVRRPLPQTVTGVEAEVQSKTPKPGPAEPPEMPELTSRLCDHGIPVIDQSLVDRADCVYQQMPQEQASCVIS